MKSVTLSSEQIERFFVVTENLKHEDPHQYERVRIKDGKVIFILYTSDKLVYNENEKNLDFLDMILHGNENLVDSESDDDIFDEFDVDESEFFTEDKLENIDDSDVDYYTTHTSDKIGNIFKQRYDEKYENKLLNYQYTIGSDETGKGEWYGPLIVTAVCTSNEENKKLKEIGVKDSKKITKENINQLYKKIEKINITHETIILLPEEYNRLYQKFQEEGKNLNHMLAHLHNKAITKLLEKTDTTNIIVIIDKFDKNKMDEELNIDPKIEVIQENNGERYIPVAASSIIAKFFFEKTLKEIEEKYNINLRETIPYRIDKNILDKVTKTHFKNVKRFL